jgi:hypothetical protein
MPMQNDDIIKTISQLARGVEFCQPSHTFTGRIPERLRAYENDERRFK